MLDLFDINWEYVKRANGPGCVNQAWVELTILMGIRPTISDPEKDSIVISPASQGGLELGFRFRSYKRK